MDQDRFNLAITQIDAANAHDPHRLELDGQKYSLEILHAERRTAWVRRLAGDQASEALLLAARAQHILRWEIPRETYPHGRAGYLKWRQDLKEFHAQKTAEILQAVGYEADLIERVKDLILKKRLKLDPEVQTLEDALCLVFLEEQFSEFAKKEGDKIADIVRKTWRKMSPAGQQFALALPLAPADRAIIEQALTV
ncbi:MAG TPA: DUF4202 domain-containing protein [Anaerolineae bacterium]|nr:DUF4202 domain-containing protein [Anaerolineae bacterium]HXV98397.1 DUF4202 domain-containing protein [Anaerolineae bacterium]